MIDPLDDPFAHFNEKLWANSTYERFPYSVEAEMPPLAFGHGEPDWRPRCPECDVQGPHTKEECLLNHMGLNDEDMDRSWHGAMRLLREKGIDPDQMWKGPEISLSKKSTA